MATTLPAKYCLGFIQQIFVFIDEVLNIVQYTCHEIKQADAFNAFNCTDVLC